MLGGARRLGCAGRRPLNFDVGSVFNFQGDGSWKTNAEAAVNQSSQWFTWFQSGFSLRYSAVSPQADDGGGNGMNNGGGGTKAGDSGSGDDDEFNPFTGSGGILETNIYLLFSTSKVPRLGLVGGWGLLSVPGEAKSPLEVRERRYVGVRETIGAINAGRDGASLQNTQGYVQLAWADDDLWKRVELTPASDTAPAVPSAGRSRRRSSLSPCS